MVRAATAFAQALKTPTAAGSTPVTPTSTATYSHQLSPNNKANICCKCLEDLHILSQLFNDGVLLESEFIELFLLV